MTGYTTSDNGNVGIPSGSIYIYAGTSAPSGWLMCNGASYNTSTYGDLFTAIGYGYGGSENSFKVPNLIGKIIMGASSDDGLNVTGGQSEASVTLELRQMPKHNHTYSDAYYASDPPGGGGTVAGAGRGTDSDNSFIYRTNDDGAQHGEQPLIDTGEVGSDSAFSFSTVPKHLEFNYIIKI